MQFDEFWCMQAFHTIAHTPMDYLSSQNLKIKKEMSGNIMLVNVSRIYLQDDHYHINFAVKRHILFLGTFFADLK